jgi:hypothetical protein
VVIGRNSLLAGFFRHFVKISLPAFLTKHNLDSV